MAEKPTAAQTREGCAVLLVGALLLAFFAQRCLRGEPKPAPSPNADRRTPEKVAEDDARAARAASRPVAASNELALTESDMGTGWPFTVPAGTLKCVGRGAWRPIIFTVGSTSYAINGTAKGRETTERYHLQDVRPIWRDNPEIPGTKIGLGELITRGHKLCPPE